MADNDTHFDADGIPVHVGDVLLMTAVDQHGYEGEVMLTVLELSPGGIVKVLWPGDGGEHSDELLELYADELYRSDEDITA